MIKFIKNWYRVRQIEKVWQNAPGWDEAPEWAMFRAIDSDGTAHWYGSEPEILGGEDSAWDISISEKYTFICAGLDARNWENSLQKRPTK